MILLVLYTQIKKILDTVKQHNLFAHTPGCRSRPSRCPAALVFSDPAHHSVFHVSCLSPSTKQGGLPGNSEDVASTGGGSGQAAHSPADAASPSGEISSKIISLSEDGNYLTCK